MVRGLLLCLCVTSLGCFDDQIATTDIINCDNDTACPRTWSCIAAQCRLAELPTPPNIDVTTNEDTAIDIELRGPIDGRPLGLVVTLVQAPVTGVVTTTENEVVGGIARYQPSPNAAARDSFSYRWTINGVDAGSGTVIVSVVPQNDAPQIAVLLDDAGTLVQTSTLNVDEGTARAFFVRVADTEGADGRLAPGEGPGHYQVIIEQDNGPCRFQISNIIADVWEARAPDDSCLQELLSTELIVVAMDADGVEVSLRVPLSRVAINDPPHSATLTVTCVGENTAQGCRGQATIVASAIDPDGDILCTIFTATDGGGNVQPIDGSWHPCRALPLSTSWRRSATPMAIASTPIKVLPSPRRLATVQP
jgi:hypothetical protein